MLLGTNNKNNSFLYTVGALHLKKKNQKQGINTFIDQKMTVTVSGVNLNLNCQAIFFHWR